METQLDYEAEVHMAVFRSEAAAEAAERALRTAGVEYRRAPLAPGRYQLADTRLRRETRAAVWAAIIGAIIGAILGAALAWFYFGGVFSIVVWIAVAVAVGGAIVGGLVGVQRTARYDDDVARMLRLDAPATLITVHTPLASHGHHQARQLLQQAGAAGFLDVPAFQASARSADGRTIIESTSVS